jgi:peptidoglycan-associated lipoprotein
VAKDQGATMNLSKILKNGFLIILASLVLTACATKKNNNRTNAR